MIDERQEELAALYALDLLEGVERAQFETALARDPALQTLVRELRDSTAALAHTAPAATPPAALKARVLASAARRAPPAGTVIRPSPSIFRAVLPWAIAASFTLATALLMRLYVSARAEADSFRQQQALSELALQTARNQLEVERLLTTRQLADLNHQVADGTQRLADAQRASSAMGGSLTAIQSRLAETEKLLADTRHDLADRERQAASLNQQLASITGASQQIGRDLGAARDQIATLTHELQTQADLANFKITTLASMLKNSPQAVAVAVWNPAKQEGVLKVEKLPALAADKSYQLWVVDPQYKDPVDGGVFTVDPQTGEQRVKFTGKQPIASVAAFAVTLERKGGVPKAEGPFVLLGK